MTRSSNALIHSSSPYLQQHAYNPVNWFPWSPAALQKAKAENKLLIISVGYSACHWCHVMEHESFEDEEVAAVMNKFFVSIKVDREERPDIDQLYMEAVQMLSGQGGWPLNCIALPDQRPIYGGTYFPKDQWREVLLQLASLWRDDPAKCTKYAEQLVSGMQASTKAILPSSEQRDEVDFSKVFSGWRKNFDESDGGMNRAPKFPMPDNYRYLLAWSRQAKESKGLEHATLTLTKMACGGIYDQLAGGFARYSTDMQWKVPHFEKMLYDNAQLVNLYTEGWQAVKSPLFREVVECTLDFVARELTSPNGGFYSALDADSEGVEGKFYVWTEKQLREIIKDDFDLFRDFFRVDGAGYWEHGNYILLRTEEEEEIASKYNLTLTDLRKKIAMLKGQLLNVRNQRVKPGLDNKILCNWNALMIRAYAFAGSVFGREDWTAIAIGQMDYLIKVFMREDGRLLHSLHAADEIPIDGFLDDYAFTIESLITLYQGTFDERWINNALKLCELVIKDFSHEELPFFYFTSLHSQKLIHRRIELQDNVTPSGNAVMSSCLYALGIISGNAGYVDRSMEMVKAMSDEINNHTPWYSRWAYEAMLTATGRNEVVFAGIGARGLLTEWLQEYQPACLIAGAESVSELSLLSGRIPDSGSTFLYVCRNRSCELPVDNVRQARDLIER